MSNGQANDPVRPSHSTHPVYVIEALEDAERLLKYSAEIGVDIDAGVRDNVLSARVVGPGGWNQKTIGDLLAALTQLAARLKPVTAASLRAYQGEDKTESTLRRYKIAAICLGICILFFSFTSFITNAFSNAINAKIGTANTLAAKLRAELGTPPTGPINSQGQTNDLSKPPPGVSPIEVITDLQQYASAIRDINARAEQLNCFIFQTESEFYLNHIKREAATNAQAAYKEFQLEVGLPNLWDAEKGRTTLYQHVRTFAQSVIDDVSTIYGAFGSCILPVLYALFGTCAYLLHNYEQQVKSRTFVPSSGDSAHFFIAGICGAVVGLFNINITQGLSPSPLAIAFLVGYGVDVFFSFLEGLLQMFTKSKNPS